MIVTILFSLVILLTLISVGKLLSIGELINRVRNRESYKITESENNWNALLALFMLFFGYLIYFYFHFEYVEGGKLLPGAASVHGEAIDKLQTVSFVIISIAYLLVQPILWFFAFKYRYKEGNKAYHYAHNNKLEMVWTVIPAIVFCGLIFYGLKIWNDTLGKEIEGDKLTVELYAKQFDWTARYAGKDKELGDANYTMINDLNSLGIITSETLEVQFENINTKRNEVLAKLNNFPIKSELAELKKELTQYNHQLQMINGLIKKNEEAKFIKAYDDIVIAPGGEIHFPVGKPIELKMRSQDVIHSAYMPHFRVHMYCVPGMTTTFGFIPTITSAEMKEKLNNPAFDYVLYCNNICGAAHFNMQMKIVIETEEEYERWLKKQPTFADSFNTKPAEEAPAATDSTSTTTSEPVAKL
ncbi:MAG: cytochrome c oxidase subunit II [Flavobacteriales bacterium]|nr:cytochrome c oxidase subunit II [Flavobacteriales bacterium]